MKNSIIKLMSSVLAILLCSMLVIPALAQETSEVQDRPVRSMFESNWLIDNQSVIVPLKGTFEMDIQHRFGTWNNGYDDLWGIYGPSNIRIGFSYVLINKLQLGFGFSKENLLWDLNVKYAILQQSQSGSMPLSLSYFGNMAIDTRDGNNFLNSSDRFSYFHQLMLARKLSDRLSIQGAVNLSHFNAVEGYINEVPEIDGKMENDHISASLMGRFKIGDATSILFNYDQPITKHKMGNPNPNISFGFEFVTSAHSFQLFVGNYRSIVPQYNNVFNKNDFGDNEILLGFNMTRLWNF